MTWTFADRRATSESFGMNITLSTGWGPFCFPLQDQVYLHACHLHTEDNIVDGHGARQARSELPENSTCLQSVFEIISASMENNLYAITYQNMIIIELQVEKRAARENIQPRRILMPFISGLDTRRYTTNMLQRYLFGNMKDMHKDIV